VRRKRTDPLEKTIESALQPGLFIGYRDDWEFVEDLEAVKKEINALVNGGEADRAVGLFETFIAGCYAKAEELDGSSGNFGTLVGELFCSWIRARQGAQADAEETAETFISWMENDNYGFCYSIDEDVVKAFDRRGLAAFETALRREWIECADESSEGAYRRRRAVEILKAICIKRRNAKRYAEICEEAGELAPKDCEVLAEISLRRQKPEEALSWIDQGLELEGQRRWPNRSSYRLPRMRREVLAKLGREAEALASVWAAFCECPSTYSYEELMEYVPQGDRGNWHTKALAELDGARLSARLELLVETKEWERLVAVVEQAGRAELMSLSHYTMEPAAKGLVKRHPLVAADLYLALGLRIVEAKKSKYYGASHRHLEAARDILLKEGRDGEWDDVVAEVREKHRRKSSFMPGFERLADGHRSGDEPSFLDRARRKWPKTRGRSK